MSAKGHGRRKFLKAGGAAAGALAVGGAGVWAATPEVPMPEASYPGTKETPERVLVAYASKAGSTAEVAAFIARRLSEAGLGVDLRRAKNVRSVDGYRAVVVGSAIRMGQWLSEATDFVKTHKGDLAARRTAFFAVCMTLKDDTPANRKEAAGYLEPVRKVLDPNRMEFFAGKMDYGRLGFATRLIVKSKKVPEGDFRNWEAIGSWTDLLAKDLSVRA